jgi:hypothetical protein
MDSISEAIQAIADLSLKRKRASRLNLALSSRGLPNLKEVLQNLYEDQCFTVKEVSNMLQVNPNTVCRWIAKFSIRRAPAKRRLVQYTLATVFRTQRFCKDGVRGEERLIVPDEELLWLLGFALGDGNIGFYLERNGTTVAPEFSVFNSQPILIEKSISVMRKWNLNPLKVSYVANAYGSRLMRVPNELECANFWKVKASSALLPASLLVTRTNERCHDTFGQILSHREWIVPFIRGMFDAEGRVRGTGRKLEVPNVSVFNTDFNLMRWIWDMLNHGLGIHTSRLYYGRYRRPFGTGRYYSIDLTGQWAIRYIREVGFCHPMKSERCNKLLDWDRS